MGLLNLFERLKKVVGGIRQDAPAATQDGDKIPFRVNENGELYTVAGTGAAGVSQVDIDQVAGTATVTGGVAGTLGIGGIDADGDAVTANPVIVAGVDGNGNVQQSLVETDGTLRVREDYDSGLLLAFDDGAGAAKAVPGAAWTPTSGTEWRSSGRATLMTVYMTIANLAAVTSLQMRIRERVSAAAPTEYLQLATNSVIAGVEDVDAHVLALPLSASSWAYRFPVDPDREYALDFYQTGGAALTALASVSFSR